MSFWYNACFFLFVSLVSRMKILGWMTVNLESFNANMYWEWFILLGGYFFDTPLHLSQNIRSWKPLLVYVSSINMSVTRVWQGYTCPQYLLTAPRYLQVWILRVLMPNFCISAFGSRFTEVEARVWSIFILHHFNWESESRGRYEGWVYVLCYSITYKW